MKYALHASLHRPARRPDQTASGLVGECGAAPVPIADKPTRPAFLPPPPTVIVSAPRPGFLPPQCTIFSDSADFSDSDFSESTDFAPEFTPQDHPILRPQPVPLAQAAVPPPIGLDEPMLDEPTLVEPVLCFDENWEEDDDRDFADRDRRGTVIGRAPLSPPDSEPLRARKKGTLPRHGELHHQTFTEIDPGAWLAEETSGRFSDRRDAADGIDSSDTIVQLVRPHLSV